MVKGVAKAMLVLPSRTGENVTFVNGAGFTIKVALWLVVPPGPVQDRLYVVVVVGLTT